jgi:hypothetical protein
MMRSVLMIVILGVYASVSPPVVFAQPERAEIVPQDVRQPAGLARDVCPAVILQDSSMELLAQGDCCSNAGGFCGCTQGTVRCCNGTIAPSPCSCRSVGPWSVTSGSSD